MILDIPFIEDERILSLHVINICKSYFNEGSGKDLMEGGIDMEKEQMSVSTVVISKDAKNTIRRCSDKLFNKLSWNGECGWR